MLRPVLRSFLLLAPYERLQFGGLVIARVAIQLLDVGGLVLVGLIVSAAGSEITGSRGQFFGISLQELSAVGIPQMLLATAVFFVVKSLFAMVLLRLTTRKLATIEAAHSKALARHLFSGGLERLNRYSPGEQMFVTSQASQVAFGNLLFSGATLVTESSLFLFVFVTFLVVDWQTAIAVALYLAVVVLVFQLATSKRVGRLGSRLAKNAISVNDSIVDLGTVFREISVFEKTSRFLTRFERARTQLSEDRGTYKFVMGIPRYMVELALILGVLGLVASMFLAGDLATGLTTASVILAGGVRLVGSLLPIQNSITDIRANRTQAELAQDILCRLVPELTKSDNQIQPEGCLGPEKEFAPPPGHLQLDCVTFSFSKDQKPVIRNLSLTIEPGDFVAIVGPSGGGKSTLANLALGLLKPTGGEVRFAGISPVHARVRYPGAVGYVPQNPGLVSGTLAENVALESGFEEIDEQRVVSALEQADLGEYLRTLPEGIHSDVGKQKNALSGGQIQRLGIARALYPNPKLLVLDEATSALDAESEAQIVKALLNQKGARTLLVIAHRLSTVRNADRVIFIESGEIRAQGTFSELKKKSNRFSSYLKLMDFKETST